jgi:hypothetical protein
MPVRLTDVEFQELPILAQALMSALRSDGLLTDYDEQARPTPKVTIAAAAPQVGDLILDAEDEEYTVQIGMHTHCHFSPFMMDGATLNMRQEQALKELLDYVRAILADEVVVWSVADGTRRGSGGTFGVGTTPTVADPGAEAWLWSGTPIALDSSGGAT